MVFGYDAPAGLTGEPVDFAIWDKFKQQGIEIPFPQRDLHLKEPVRVEVESAA